MSRTFLALLAVLSTAVVAAAACQGLPPIELCGEIPGEGCPIGRGGSCEDVTCTALYSCNNGQWVLTQVCPVPEGGTGGSAADGGPDFADAGPCVPVTIDAGQEGNDCMPDLDFPDCPLAAATCVDTACYTGCSDFFFCAAGPCGGGPGPCWVDVAYCNDYAQLVVTGPEM